MISSGGGCDVAYLREGLEETSEQSLLFGSSDETERRREECSATKKTSKDLGDTGIVYQR